LQTLQAHMQQRVLVPALALTKAFAPPGFMRFLPRTPIVRKLPPRLIGFCVWPVHVRE
jgi:hypothetical protein